MLATMQHLGVTASRSRPAVSNDNPYSEALFRTLKYRPALTVKAFDDLLQARRGVTEWVHWYNHEDRHSAISVVTLGQRHTQTDIGLLKAKDTVYAAARTANPNRWAGPTRDWSRSPELWRFNRPKSMAHQFSRQFWERHLGKLARCSCCESAP